MTFDQTVASFVLILVVAGLIWGRWRSDVVALAGAAVLIALGVVRPVEAQAAFASPALITLASLFVMAYALELSGVLGALIRAGMRLCQRFGQLGLWLVISSCGAASAFLNNTPIVILSAPVVSEVAHSLKVSPRRFLIPLSYATILGGSCTLIGTSTNLLVNDMARNAGQPAFKLFDIAPVGLSIAAAGAAYLIFVAPRLLGRGESNEPVPLEQAVSAAVRSRDLALGEAKIFLQDRPLDIRRGLIASATFLAMILVAALGIAPIAATAFAGAVTLIILGVITPDEAYRGLRPQILILVAGMVVVGMSLELSGLAAAAVQALSGPAEAMGPWLALILLYAATSILTELLSNAAVAVLLTPLAVALAEGLGVSPLPFVVAVMMGASAAFATPFGYQTNVIVYQHGGYAYMDFVRVGLPMNLVTWMVGSVVIPLVFPF